MLFMSMLHCIIQQTIEYGSIRVIVWLRTVKKTVLIRNTLWYIVLNKMVCHLQLSVFHGTGYKMLHLIAGMIYDFVPACFKKRNEVTYTHWQKLFILSCFRYKEPIGGFSTQIFRHTLALLRSNSQIGVFLFCLFFFVYYNISIMQSCLWTSLAKQIR